MGLRDMLKAEVDRLEAAHEVNRVAYRDAKAVATEANERVRAANDVASASANELAAATDALRQLDKHQPKAAVVGSGELKGGVNA